MFARDIRLAWHGLRRHPGLTVLTVITLAIGIGAALMAIAQYHARAGHPIVWKENLIHAVMLDTRGPERDREDARHPEYPPFQLTYRDAKALHASGIPARSVMSYVSWQTVTPTGREFKPFNTAVRLTSADFFDLFDVPFRYGSGWTREADEAPEPTAVISRGFNERLFGGENSVGRLIELDGKQYRVVGVLDTWLPMPKFYDLTNGNFDIPEDIYLPFGWATARQIGSAGEVSCVTDGAAAKSFAEFLTSECVWLQYWVELRTNAEREHFQQFIDGYALNEKAHGRFPRPLNNRIVTVSQWLAMNDVVGGERRTELILAVLFLAVCILNTVGILLTQFLRNAPIAGLRRALGATRADIVRQHLLHVTITSLTGGIFGALLAQIGLISVRWLTYAPSPGNSAEQLAVAQALSRLDLPVLGIAVGLSLLTGLCAGLYPAWQIGRLAPAGFLKA